MESSGNNPSSPSLHKHDTRYKKRRFEISYKEDSDTSDNDFLENDEQELNPQEYQAFLANLYPSQYITQKVINSNSKKNKPKKNNLDAIIGYNSNIKIIIDEDDDYEEDEEEDDDYEEDDYEEDEEEDEEEED